VARVLSESSSELARRRIDIVWTVDRGQFSLTYIYLLFRFAAIKDKTAFRCSCAI